MKKIFAGIFVLICAVTLFACDGSNSKQFGYFTHNGYALTTFSTKSISYADANARIVANSPFNNSRSIDLYTTSFGPVLTEDQMKEMMVKYSSVTIDTKYWDGNTQISRSNTVYLTTYVQDNVVYYPEILKSNQNTLATGLVVNNMILTPSLHDYYEQINQDFINDGGRVDAPFLDMYSYGENPEGLLTLTVSDYSSNNSSITGTSTMEIHQTESVYGENNLIVAYQASFGISYATPGDTAYVGTVLEATFTWNEMK